LRSLRLRALAPRVLVWLALGLLCSAGLRAIIERPSQAVPAAGGDPGIDLPAAAFAESFVRAYLSWDPLEPERRERTLAGYLASGLDADAGLSPGGEARTVLWAHVERQEGPPGRRRVTVVAQTTQGLTHLAVSVTRDQHGFLAIATPPAVVGAPAVSRDAEAPQEDDVEDERLRAIAERAVRNYLAGERENLLADLAPNAVVSLPTEPLRVRSTDAVTWVTRGRRVAVTVEAETDDGTRWTLRYELGVLRRDRWYVRSIHTDPTSRGGT
jgi:Conjugative transposon protein TcpC